ncbi:hypothetical protein J7384_17925 [Endozoicomonas sp. G2_1]|uniref:hypothetical protein n=1 Tax=Endozoicomonas sp. G2_1 TaxID=2821091 RepID=UPI001AD9D5E5|nr:hypothetical protein [Endozoicomonas sp. G2_1]MBO9492245.1 hypothetical protein [Endozoicomonas sp. G2_1]
MANEQFKQRAFNAAQSVLKNNEENKVSEQDLNQAKTEAITSFLDTMIGALESGFTDKNNPTLAEIYHFATWHIKDNYRQDIPSLAEKWGEYVEAECKGNSAQDKWLKTDELPPENEKLWYWVYIPTNDAVILARFNNYKQYGGFENCWQDICNDDFELANTLYQPITEPLAPKK